MSIDPRSASEPNTSDLAIADTWEKLIDAALKSHYAGQEEIELYIKEREPSERVKVEIDRRYKASGWRGGVFISGADDSLFGNLFGRLRWPDARVRLYRHTPP